MKTAHKVLAGAVTVIVLIAGVVAWWLPDAQALRQHLRDELAEATGRTVNIKQLDWAWSPTPTVVLTGVSVANAGWGRAPALVRAERVTLFPKLDALFTGRVVFDKVRVEGPALFLESRAGGEQNWDGLNRAGTGNGDRLRVEISEVAVSAAEIEVRQPHGTSVYHVSDFALRADGDVHQLNIAIADASGTPWLTGEGVVGGVRGLGIAPLRVNLTVKAADESFSATFDGLIEPKQLDGELNVRAAVPALGDESVVNVSGTARGPWSTITLKTRELTLQRSAGETRGDATLTLDTRNGRPLVAGVMSLDRVVMPPGTKPSSPPRIRLPSLPVDVAIELAVGDVKVDRHDLRNARGAVAFEPGQLHVSGFSANLGGGLVTGRASLFANASEIPRANLTLTLEQVASSALLPASTAQTLRARVDGRIKLQMSGNDARAWLQDLNGELRLASRDGEIRTRTVENLVGGVPALLESLIAGDRDWVRLNCAVVAADIRNSVAIAKAFVVDTPKTTVVVEGEVGIPDGPLALLVTPHPKTATLNLAVPVRVTGPLHAPAYAPDERATALRAGGLVAGLIFPPALIAAFADFGYQTDGCVGGRAASAVADGAKVLGKAGETTQAVASGAVKVIRDAGDVAGEAANEAGQAASRAGQAAEKAVTGALKEVGKTIKGLFGN